MSSELVKLRRQAERAVHDMPQGELKTKAFETILVHLLSGTAGKGVERAGAGKRAQAKQKAAGSKVPRSLRERILFLRDEGFFGSQKSIAEIRQELKKNGWHHATTALSGPLQSLVQRRLLRRERVADDEQRPAWKYSNP
jgi:hypothetical protein